MQILGIDIGGSGIKGAPVDIDTGELVAERYRIPTPDPSEPNAVADVVKEIVTMHGGTVAVESNEGVGSTFKVRLPLCAEPLSGPYELAESGGAEALFRAADESMYSAKREPGGRLPSAS